MAETRLFSIGHSNHDLPRLVELLRQAGVTAIADVRSRPYSQRYPHFNRPDLRQGLAQHGIAYAFLGDQLGGRPDGPELYDGQGRVDYERVRATRFFQQGIDRLLKSLGKFTTAMLCAEEDPMDCHRGLMIGPALVERGIFPVHLRADGRHETTAEFEERLLKETGVGEAMREGMFAAMLSEEERRFYVAEAYRMLTRRRAFRLRVEKTPSGGDLGE
jgi:uncharacterized protein (DUF488 family)